MMRDGNRMYRSFEEFEREELRPAEKLGMSIDDLMDDVFVQELDFDFEGGGRKRADADEDDEE